MFTVFAEKNIFEDILIDNNKTPNWFRIFCDHSEICLNITNAELDLELSIDSPISYFYKITGGKEPRALNAFFGDVYDNNSIISECPRSAFFLNISKNKADDLQKSLGIVVQAKGEIDDQILKGTYYKNLPINTVCEAGPKIGWHHLLDIQLSPMNAIVVSDNYLFTNDEGKRGKVNFIQFIESILPDDLGVDFHILLIAKEHNLKDVIWCNTILDEIKLAISQLNKPYNVIFELVFAETIHKRIAISNYATITPDKGFAVFKTHDVKTVHEDTEIQVDRIFNRIHKNEGDTEFENANYSLDLIKTKCKSVAQYIIKRPDDKNYRILGDCNPDKSLKNRLINDI